MAVIERHQGNSGPAFKPDPRATPGLRWLVDTLAVLSFFTVVGAMNERFIVGMSWPEVLKTRLAAIPVLLLSGAMYGYWRDLLHRLTRFEAAGRLGRTLIDTVTCLSYRVPIYALILVLGGASGWPLLHGTLSGAVIIALSGRPCGIWIDFLRRVFLGTPIVDPAES